MLDDFPVWVVLAAVLVLLAYGPPLASMVGDGLLQPGSPPFSPWLG